MADKINNRRENKKRKTDQRRQKNKESKILAIVGCVLLYFCLFCLCPPMWNASDFFTGLWFSRHNFLFWVSFLEIAREKVFMIFFVKKLVYVSYPVSLMVIFFRLKQYSCRKYRLAFVFHIRCILCNGLIGYQTLKMSVNI